MIGLGRMGGPMAGHLSKAGFEVWGYDVDKRVRESWARDGGKITESLQDLGPRVEVTIVLVGTDEECRTAVLGSGGYLESAREGATLIISSTVRRETVWDIAEAAREKGVRVLDAPICRGEHAAVTGELLIMAGGEEALLEEERSILEAFSTDIFLVGELGAGQVAKTVNNLLLWAAFVANVEGLRLAESAGVSPDDLRRALLKSSASNWALDNWEMLDKTPWAKKDMAFAMEMADGLGISLPLSGQVKELVKTVGRFD